MQNWGISLSNVREAIESADKTQNISDFENNVIATIGVKYFSNDKNYAIISLGHWSSQGNFQLASVFKVYEDICNSFNKRNPTELLYELTNKFGFNLTLGGVKQKFFFMQDIPIKPETTSTNIENTDIDKTNFLAHENIIKSYLGADSQSLVVFGEKDGKLFMRCMLAFKLNVERYSAYVRKSN